ncbi:MAG TPA: BTAD domain-containing putative transcriptional regulator, partial [Micromonosporaceae bacterium]|nr:BTAD domain-containing putative transcriptional regulator [Micromonosporaceae bacterium]
MLLLTRVSYQGKEIAGIRLHNLLALLADGLRSGCGTARLVRGLWPEQRPENPSKALQILVSRLRARLGQDAVVRTTTGYRLALREDQVDASVLLISTVASVRSAAAGDHANALVHAEAGLAVWDGVAEPDGVPEGPLASLRAERALVRRSLVRARALALSRLGHPGEAFEPLADIAAERRYDEEVLVELLRSEAATNGPAAALARYEAYRRALREELGTGPGDEVRAMHGLLLQHQTPRVWHGVPHDPNPLLGRADDIARVKDLLRSSRVVSIVGTGGLGKTRLAYAVSREAEQRTVHVVGLAGISSDEDVVNEVSSVLGVTEARRTPGPVVASVDALSGIINALGPGPAVLVLDNCEHVIRGVAELVHALVARAPEVRVLTTSRAPLGLSSESVHRLPELHLSTAVELFRQRARAARPDVELSTDTIEELCRHLDGLPLAIELAAARVRALSVGEIARRLDDRFGLLSGGMRDAPSRHRTLHAVVDWSWNLLSPSGQAAMRTLSIFPGGFTVDAAQRVLGGDRTLDLLEDLVGQSLLKVTDTPTGIRFRMLETVREFSSDHQTAAEMDQMTNHFLAWAREFGVAHHDSLVSADPFSAVERVRAEQDNLVQALRHGLARSDGATVAATSAALAGLWTLDDDYARTVTLANETAWVLSHYRPKPEFVEATRVASALSTVNMFMLQGRRPLRSWVTLRRLPPAPPDSLIGAVATVLDALRSDFAGLESLCGSDEPLLAGIANGIASYLAESQGDSDHALRTARRMSDAMDGRGPPLIQIQARSRVAELCLRLERGDEARQHLKVALRLLERSGPRSNAHQIQVWWALVLANLQSGAVEEAARWLGL